MKTLIPLTLLFMSLNSLAFTLNSSTGRGYQITDIPIYVSPTSCAAAGFSTSDLESMVEEAVDDYWNIVPTSSVNITMKGSSSIDIDGDSFNSAIAKVPSNTILAGCNDDVTAFPDSGILGAAVMSCSGDNCSSVLILNAHSTTPLQNQTRSQIVATIAHEIGHAIGIGHSEFEHSLMYYSSGAKQTWLGQDDIDAVTYLYPHKSQYAGLLGSCGTIEMVRRHVESKNKDNSGPSGFMFSFTFGLMATLLVFYRRNTKIGKAFIKT